MGFFKYCITGAREHASDSIVNSNFVPLISAKYDHSEPFGYIIIAITGLMVIAYNILFIKKFWFKPRQHFLWAFTMWGNCLFLFQMMLVISRYVNRLQLVIAIFHNSYELFMTYWVYMTNRGYISSPLDNKIQGPIQRIDRVIAWIYSVLASVLIIGQLITIILFDDLKYGIYAFYLILVGDTFFIGSTIVCFVQKCIKGQIRRNYEIASLFVAVMGHTIYAANNVLTCEFTTFTADIALVSYAISMVAISWCQYYTYRHRKADEPCEESDNMPDDVFCCKGI